MLDDALNYNIRDIIFKNTDRLGRNDVDRARCKKLARFTGLPVFCFTLPAVVKLFVQLLGVTSRGRQPLRIMLY
ncbi:MAG: hypothetical protein FWF73_00070 [Spirochaetes bacterium]|nr:hypothetical protein [Spirochaetota bacterium]